MGSGSQLVQGIPEGDYIVEVIPPAGYEIVKEEDKNVDFGDDYEPDSVVGAAGIKAPACVGQRLYPVPDEYSLFPLFDDDGDPVPPYRAGEMPPLCNRKQVYLSAGQNASANFFLFTEVPIAGHIYGFVLDDTANEFDPRSPQFGEKYAPPWLPISLRDWKGKEIHRVYTDEYGVYNLLVPSTYTANLPQPSGISPSMLTVAINSPVMPDPDNPGEFIMDPYFNRKYSQFSYTFQFMPGTTTYLDTPVLPIAAFAGADQFPLDCEFPDGTPKIYSVSGALGGPYVSAIGEQISIISEGANVAVSNPAYEGIEGSTPKSITRDYGFGSSGTVSIGDIPLIVDSWTPDLIVATIPEGAKTGELAISRNDNCKSSIVGLTVTIATDADTFNVLNVPQGGSIQDVIDIAEAGDLILVPPGNYEELVIMWKPVRLQGWGPGSVIINAVKVPSEKLDQWRQKVNDLIDAGSIDLLPGQQVGGVGIEPEVITLFTEEGSGILVLSLDEAPESGGFGLVNDEPNARIDGLTITGADHAGGIVVNGYAHYLEISNNRIINNAGFYGGGIRIGHSLLVINDDTQYQSAYNDHVRIHNNHITQNSGLGERGNAAGGVALCAGADNYEVSENFICGNFTLGEGGGIGHLGLSDNGTIAQNTIIFNESFRQGSSVSGGGISIAGAPPLGGAGVSLSPGSGSVKVISNLILGNSAGAGDGGGIRTNRINGQDVENNPNNPADWYSVDILNNMIVNNMAALAGGGISMQDTALINILHNTIANNDSTAVASEAFTPGVPNQSNPQPAGIVARKHSPELAAVFGEDEAVDSFKEFPNPQLTNNIIWHNRSFYFYVDENQQNAPVYNLLPDPNTPVYDDLGVLGTASAELLDPQFCILSDTTVASDYNVNNTLTDPLFISEYVNGDRGLTIKIPEPTTAFQAPAAWDEGGNFIKVRFGPLTLNRVDNGQPYGNYHLMTGSPAVDIGNNIISSFSDLTVDYDGEARPDAFGVDIGADEAMPDTITITKLEFQVRQTRRREIHKLIIQAASDAPGGCVTLTASWNDGAKVYNEVMRYRAYRGDYIVVNRRTDKPVSNVTITSTGGGLVNGLLTERAPDRRTSPKKRFKESPKRPAPYWESKLTKDEFFNQGKKVISETGLINFHVGNKPDESMPDSTKTDTAVFSDTSLFVQCPGDTDGDCIIDTPDPAHPNAVCMHITSGDGYATMADGEPMYIFGFADLTGTLPNEVMNAGMLAATYPAPTIVLDEGDEFYLNLTNVGMAQRPDLFDPHSVHWHGFPEIAAIFDGVPGPSIAINMGYTLTYYYNVVEPGTYIWHCHVEATEHMQMGMLGSLYVHPRQDGTPYTYKGREYTKFAYNDGDGSTGYDVEYPIQISHFDPDFHYADEHAQPLPFAAMEDKYPMLNGRGYPDTINPNPLPAPAKNGGKISQNISSLIEATVGQRILLRVTSVRITSGTDTITVLGIPMQVIAKGARMLRGPSPDGGITPGKNLYYETNTLTLAGGEAYDVILDTTDAAPGRYFLYTTNLQNLNNNTDDFGGMMTEIIVNAE